MKNLIIKTFENRYMILLAAVGLTVVLLQLRSL